MPLGNKALTDGFNMTANKTVVFTEVFQNRNTAMGWNQGTKQVITFNNIGKQQKEEQQKNPFKANSATVAAVATEAVNPQFAALMALVAAMANLDQKE